jgi:filamentous hemagglutinin
MSTIKPVIRELRQAVLKGFSHAKTRLHQLTDNINTHLDDLTDGVDVLDSKRVTKTPVKEFDVDAFKNLKHREVVGDALQHDHIPSSAALRRARENELGRRLTPDERRALHNDATAVELSDLLHSQSRTFRGRNTQSQVDLDAGDLNVAMEKDLRTLAKNLKADGRLTSDEIATLIQEIRDLNRKRGIG